MQIFYKYCIFFFHILEWSKNLHLSHPLVPVGSNGSLWCISWASFVFSLSFQIASIQKLYLKSHEINLLFIAKNFPLFNTSIIHLLFPEKVKNSAISLITKATPPTTPIPRSTKRRWVM